MIDFKNLVHTYYMFWLSGFETGRMGRPPVDVGRLRWARLLLAGSSQLVSLSPGQEHTTPGATCWDSSWRKSGEQRVLGCSWLFYAEKHW